MKFVIATTTLNSSSVIGEFLQHAVNLAVTAVLVMDLGSTDATLDIIAGERWKHLVEIIPSRGLAEDDPSNRTLEIAGRRYPGLWCLFCDPDEFVTPGVSAYQPPDDVSVLLLPRFNVTGLRDELTGDGLAWEALVYEIARPVLRSAEAQRSLDLSPPWIFLRVGDKTMVRLGQIARIGPGDHSAEVVAGQTLAVAALPIRHYPIRTYSEFELKVQTIEKFFAINPHFPPDWGWHWRRWVRLMQQGKLLEEFRTQFIGQAELAGLLADGTIHRVAPVSVCR